MKNNNKVCLVALIVCVALLVLLLSGVTGLHVVTGDDYDTIERYTRLEEIRGILVGNYYKEVDEDALMEGAIDGMMASLDDVYSFYYTPDELTAHDEAEQGNFVGVGILVERNNSNEIEILRAYDGGPAQKAGLRTGDCIISVDGEALEASDEQGFTENVNKLRREEGQQVCLGIRRGEDSFEVTLTCTAVTAPNVESSMLEGNIGYIAIYQFAGDDVTAFEAALEELQEEGARGLIIDLRNNPGGLLEHGAEIADDLLPEGVIVSIETRDGESYEYKSDADYCDLPVAVLVNGGSASTSEILSAALQDYGRATIVGTTTYGKGIVQTLVRFDDGSGMQFTSEIYYTPSGRSIHGIGVTPDVIAEEADDDVINSASPDPTKDTQLRRAIEVLTGSTDDTE